MKKGKFIVLEGIDGSGKSTQSRMLTRKLQAKGIDVFETLQPTFGDIGKLLRRYLSGELTADPKVLAGLFASDRLNHLLCSGGILEAYNQGKTIICDRNYFSSLAYQDDNDGDFVLDINQKAREILKPDVHIFIDLKPIDALNRIKESDREFTEIFENEKELNRIYANYHKYFELLKDEENIIKIDGTGEQTAILEEVYQKISYLFDGE